MTNYRIGAHRTTSDCIGLYGTTSNHIEPQNNGTNHYSSPYTIQEARSWPKPTHEADSIDVQVLSSGPMWVRY